MNHIHILCFDGINNLLISNYILLIILGTKYFFIFFVTWTKAGKPNSIVCAEFKYVVNIFQWGKVFKWHGRSWKKNLYFHYTLYSESRCALRLRFANTIKLVQACIDARGHHFQHLLKVHSDFPNADLQKVFAHTVKRVQACIDVRDHHF
jgi:hypothetical protein